MLEIFVLAILVVGVSLGMALSAGEKELASRTWPEIRPSPEASAPAEEGAPVAEGAAGSSGEEQREAA